MIEFFINVSVFILALIPIYFIGMGVVLIPIILARFNLEKVLAYWQRRYLVLLIDMISLVVSSVFAFFLWATTMYRNLIASLGITMPGIEIILTAVYIFGYIIFLKGHQRYRSKVISTAKQQNSDIV